MFEIMVKLEKGPNVRAHSMQSTHTNSPFNGSLPCLVARVPRIKSAHSNGQYTGSLCLARRPIRPSRPSKGSTEMRSSLLGPFFSP